MGLVTIVLLIGLLGQNNLEIKVVLGISHVLKALLLSAVGQAGKH